MSVFRGKGSDRNPRHCAVVALVSLLSCVSGHATDYFVTTNGSDSAAGTNWPTAFLSLSNAVAHASDNDFICVSNGVYAITTTLLVSNGIAIVGVNGYTNTLISVKLPAYGTIPGVKLAHSNAVLRGFTVTHSVNQFDYNQYGPLYLQAGLVEECLLTGNTNRSVGGIYMTGGMLRNTVVTKNHAHHANTGYGGGVRMTGGIVTNCLIYNNRGVDGGGGVAMWGGIVQYCPITNNAATIRGGGVYMSGGTLENCLVTRNSIGDSYQGGGLHMVNGAVRFCTIAENSRTGGYPGAGLYMTGGSVSNSIMYHNGSLFPAVAVENVDQRGGTIAYSCSQPAVAGIGNIGDDPDFVDRAACDYHLAFGSACIDSGASMTGVTLDLDFSSRSQDGDADTIAVPDMGCFEAGAAGGTFACTFEGTPIAGTNSLQVAFSASVAGPGTNTVTYYWDFDNDGTVDETSMSGAVTNDYPSGMYSVRLVCTNSLSQGAFKIRTDYILVRPSTCYVASAGSNTFPYDSWAKAAAGIPDAVNAVVAGGTVVLSSEVHTVSQKIIVNRPMTITSIGSFTNTTLKSPGGVRIMDITDPGVTLERVRLTGINLSYPNSGAINMLGGTVRYCSIVGNTLGTYGGGIHMEGGLVHDCIITNNGAVHVNTGYAGGLYMTAGVVSNCLISNNRSVDGAGGVQINGGLMVNCVITNNYASRSSAVGGGLYLNGGTIANCLITHNRLTEPSATGGGGVRMANGTMVNCTVADNWRAGGNNYSGLFMTGGAVTNSVFYNNSSAFPVFNQENVYSNAGRIVYSCMQPLADGAGNTSDDPMFVNRSVGDYRLSGGSSCLDTGTNVSWLSIDLDGNSRLTDGDGNGVTNCDIGCYERADASTVFSCSFTADPTIGTNSLQTVFTADVMGPGTNSVFYCWDWTGDGTNDLCGAAQATVTNTYLAPGYYNVRLTCTNALGDTADQMRVAYIIVYSTNAYVSTSGSDTFPYDTWEKAASTIGDALSVTPAGGTVYVADGTLTVSFPVTIDQDVTIRSINGPSNTVLNSTGPQIFLLRHANALVEGFTLRGASLSYYIYGIANLDGGTLRNCIITGNNIGSCGGVGMTAGLIENCVITNNFANHWNTGFGGGIRMWGGTVSNCVIRDNRAMDGAGGIYMEGGTVCNSVIDGNRPVQGANDCAAGGVWMKNGTLLNCYVTSNWVSAAVAAGAGGIRQEGGLVRNCLISRNAVTNLGGGVWMSGGLMENCTIADNISLTNKGGGVYMTGGAITNTIVYDNNAAKGTNIWRVAGSIGYSCSPDLTGGINGNITDDPLFAPAGEQSYRLLDGSPCIDKGIERPWMPDSLDLAGKDRIERAGVDMGAFENKPPGGTVILVR